MDRGDLFRKFGEWSETFDFIIDGDYIKIKSEDMDAFMDALDKSFEDWESPEKKSQKM